MPALATTMSMPPKRATAAAAARSTAARSVTSATADSALSAPSCDCSASSGVASMSSNTTFAPRATTARAVPAPMPCAAPVINTTLSLSVDIWEAPLRGLTDR